jgi:hypothetical protein
MKTEELIFDQSKWPKETEITLPTVVDFGSLWQTHEDQMAAIFAESLVNNPPVAHLYLIGNRLWVDLHLWEVGDDSVSYRFDLLHEVTDYVELYGDDDQITAALRNLANELLKLADDPT